ncbi:TetR/AcrR family transcriptional regulator [Actinomadura montaniterrae]|uniref:TetR family transcriptional regulator n=1 Tax=Actinomadura montaniterrae TaxID=1803903 RepID=A0A6L3VHZ4_9ACTN|nr:TetR family transcriptional regulator C-terminal domain-containing protein [Actinomadura montaniterrae]KAB2362669.1 TetR family transcriptional regulator [Actinomadura montaniterrae]
MTDTTAGQGADRRRLLAEAAISTLARAGMRGLTHRAVDETAGLPPGSCSYYFRTRQALLQGAVERLAETDLAEMAERPPLDHPATLADIAERAAALIAHMTTAGRERVLARYELVLEATRRPELKDVLEAAADRHRALIEGILAAAGAPVAAGRAPALVACLDGLLHEQVVGTADLTPTELRRTVRTLLESFTAPP